jgi:hypothetical protein
MILGSFGGSGAIIIEKTGRQAPQEAVYPGSENVLR